MRLLHVDRLEFGEFRNDPPPYAIASHRWVDDELTYQDLLDGRKKETPGYRKVQCFANYVRGEIPGVEWLWIDTCCIDKKSSAELSKAIHSMFRWYRDATVCLTYLRDVHFGDTDPFNLLHESEWFQRGWTLQELLASRLVLFLTSDWRIIGHKGPNTLADRGSETVIGPSLIRALYEITNIPISVLQNFDRSQVLPVEVVLGWASGRRTSEEEDRAYCLVGIFDVSIPACYGEGMANAFRRLRQAIDGREAPSEKRVSTSDWHAFMTGKYTPVQQTAQPKITTTSDLVIRIPRPQPPPPSSPPASSALKCPTCKSSFINWSQAQLEQHRRDAHRAVFPNDCPTCKRSYQSRNARDDHIRVSHPGLRIRR